MNKRRYIILLIFIIITCFIILSGCEDDSLIEGEILYKVYTYDSKDIIKELTGKETNEDLNMTKELYSFIIKDSKTKKQEKIYVTNYTYSKYEVGDTYKGHNLLMYIKFNYIKMKLKKRS